MTRRSSPKASKLIAEKKESIKAKIADKASKFRGSKAITNKPASHLEQVLSHPNEITLGTKSDGELLFVHPKVRSMHTHLLGGTGKGKSTLLEHMIRQDIRKGAGVCLIDPHGGHSEGLLNNILRWLEDSVILKDRKVHLIDPSDTKYVTGFNPLLMRSGVDISVTTEAALQAMEAAWGDEETKEKPRLRRVLTATLALLSEHGLSIAESELLFDSTAGRKKLMALVEALTDRYAKSVWSDVLAMKPTEYREYLEAPINRLAEFIRSDAVRRMIGQTDHAIDFREAMDDGDIVLVNLQGGDKASEASTRLLGTLIVRDLFEQSKKRKNPKDPFYFYIDECHQYLSGDIPRILDEARKSGLHVTLSHQRLGQLETAGENILNAVRGSTELKIVMGGLSIEEAKIMAEEIIPLDTEKPVVALIAPTTVGHKTITLQSASIGEVNSTAHTKAAGFSESSGSATQSGSGMSNAASDSMTMTMTGDAFLMDVPYINSVGEHSSEATTDFSSHSDSYSLSTSESAAKSEQSGKTITEGVSEAREAILEDRPTSVHGLDKVLYLTAKSLRDLETGKAIVATGRYAVGINTPHVKPRDTSKSLTDIKEEVYRKSAFSITIEEAEEKLSAQSERIDKMTLTYSNSIESSFDPWET